jgi:hypothetical protein
VSTSGEVELGWCFSTLSSFDDLSSYRKKSNTINCHCKINHIKKVYNRHKKSKRTITEYEKFKTDLNKDASFVILEQFLLQ